MNANTVDSSARELGFYLLCCPLPLLNQLWIHCWLS